MNRPTLSTIVVAHDRREFLRGAVSSVMAQTLPRDRHEIIVVKNYSDSDLDAWFSQHDVRSLVVQDSRMGAKVAAAVPELRGDVVCLLEDDDRFEPNKLEVTAQVFGGSDRSVFFHHGFTTVTPEGRRFEAPRLWQKSSPRAGGDPENLRISAADLPALWWLSRYHPDFNTSSMAIRRSLLGAYLEYLAKVDLVVDAFLFYCAMASGEEIALSARALSVLRVHGASVSLHQSDGSPEQVRQLAEYSRRNLPSVLEIAEMLRSTGRAPLVHEGDGLVAAERALAEIRGERADRRSMLGLWESMLRHSDTYAVRSRPELPFILGAILLTPSGGRWLYRTFKKLGF